jgi:septal ring factor EnvC (AmiA/AmiB activator)
MFKSIDEYVATLSEEERERHKDLIEECRKREVKIRQVEKTRREFQVKLLESREISKKAIEECRKNEEKLEQTQEKLQKTKAEMRANSGKLRELLKRLREATAKLQIKAIPAKKFAKA